MNVFEHQHQTILPYGVSSGYGSYHLNTQERCMKVLTAPSGLPFCTDSNI